ncbi:MAG: hypothetical protein JJT88_14265 [Gammaproteobacteria bacterium]|nr:hypothetical protein [Gammaproteobacteria bacterium]
MEKPTQPDRHDHLPRSSLQGYLPRGDGTGRHRRHALLDIKLVIAEFLPSEAIVQPPWSHEIMREYWLRKI